MMGKQDRAYSLQIRAPWEVCSMQWVCGTNTVIVISFLKQARKRAGASLWIVYQRGEVFSLFRPVVMACMFQEIIFSVSLFQLLFGLPYSYMGLKDVEGGSVVPQVSCLLLCFWFLTLLFFPCLLSSSPYLWSTFTPLLSVFHWGMGRYPSCKECFTMLIKILLIYLKTYSSIWRLQAVVDAVVKVTALLA